MRVLVCGGRDYDKFLVVDFVLSIIHAHIGITQIIEGGARGADALARRFGNVCDIPVSTFEADWQGWGKVAGRIRNLRMLSEGCPDLVVAFPGGKGTAHMVHAAGIHKVRVLDLRKTASLALSYTDILGDIRAIQSAVSA